ncbi:MAG TPA: hypothetical protein VGO62_00185 [Myxococcota bacterium]|jgi:hypothetical protein
MIMARALLSLTTLTLGLVGGCAAVDQSLRLQAQPLAARTVTASLADVRQRALVHGCSETSAGVFWCKSDGVRDDAVALRDTVRAKVVAHDVSTKASAGQLELSVLTVQMRPPWPQVDKPRSEPQGGLARIAAAADYADLNADGWRSCGCTNTAEALLAELAGSS